MRLWPWGVGVKKIDVIVIGAGAAGLMCAREAGRRGRQVLIIDHANKAGKKILMSGGGRCNFTNLHVRPECFISHNPHFCKSALSRYTPQHFIEMVKQYAIPFHEKTLGQLFCNNKSKDILHMLLAECEKNQIAIQLKTTVENIQRQEGGGFSVRTSQGQYTAESVVIATGGLSIPTMGASPFGYRVAEQFGIKILPTRAGLVPFTLHDHDKQRLSELSGISAACTVTCNKQSFTEDMLFTHRGLSGPAMLQVSSYWQPGDALKLQLLPDVNWPAVLTRGKKSNPRMTLINFLSAYLPKKLLAAWFSQKQQQTTLAEFSAAKINAVATDLSQAIIKPNNTEGYRTAEVTLGGVDTNALSSQTMEVREVSGLYFIGEVCDVTGWLGGYNFQWAWASGVAAGQVV